MSDAHDRFRSWLTDGGRTDIPRDVALHASTCDGCLLLGTGLDALLSVDPAAAGAPPAIPGATRPTRSPIIGRVMRSAAGAAAVGLVTLAVVIGIGSVIRPDGGGLADLNPSVEPTPAEGVLGGVGGGIRSTPEATATPSPSTSATERLTASPAAGTTTPGDVTPGPMTPPFATAVPTPRPTAVVATPPPAPATPAPTAIPSSAPPTPAPTPTPTPTSTPTPTPTPTPPTPSPSCEPLDPLCDLP